MGPDLRRLVQRVWYRTLSPEFGVSALPPTVVSGVTLEKVKKNPPLVLHILFYCNLMLQLIIYLTIGGADLRDDNTRI